MGLSNSSNGYSQNESIFVQLWFWMIVIGVILLIIAAIAYAATREARWWTWVLVGVGAGMVALGIILGAFYANRRPSYPQYGYAYPQQPQMRAGCAPGVIGSAPQMVQPSYVTVPAGTAIQPMAVTAATPTMAPQTLATPGGAPINTPGVSTYGMLPHTVVSTSAETPVRVMPTTQPGPANIRVG